MPLTEFAVCDFETTGLFPGGHDRIIEVAVVRIDTDGRTIDEYATLVNPRRDLGPTHIHGIKAGDLLSAPEFADIAGDILALLENAIFVAHNVSFDLRFLLAEMRRAHIDIPSPPHLCTMRLASTADPFACGRSLADLCDYYGIALQNAHCALDDARAAAQLLATCLKQLSEPLGPPCLCGEPLDPASWPKLPRSGRALCRKEAAARRDQEKSYISRLLSRLPSVRDESAAIDEYLSLIDRVLEDRRITAQEADALEILADDLDITREHAAAAHERYLADLITVAIADGVVSESEQSDLAEVRQLLAISEARAVELLDQARTRIVVASEPPPGRVQASEFKGKTICFTGELTSTINGEPIERDHAHHIAIEHGMIPKNSVTLKLDYLVTADPDSMSGKAQKARKYGVRILAESVFWRMVGVATD